MAVWLAYPDVCRPGDEPASPARIFAAAGGQQHTIAVP